MTEVKAKRAAGPLNFEQLLFTEFVQSPLGLVPKANNKVRMIFHLSYNFKEGEKSINHYTPEQFCSVKYDDLDQAVRSSLQLKLDTIFYAKTDVSNAFKLVPLNRWSWRWCVMAAEHPEMGETKWFFDKTLPFGSSMSCTVFQAFSECLKHIAEYYVRGIAVKILCYLDDFICIAMTEEDCEYAVSQFLKICEHVGVPIVIEKTVWPTTRIEFLGIILDGRHKIMCIPENKRNRAIHTLVTMINSKKATVKVLESLAGYLNFLNKAIFPGRAFTRRMYSKFSKLVELKNLRKHHHVNLDREFKEDCQVWLSFLDKSNIMSVCCPFVDLASDNDAKDLFFFTDASKSVRHGGFGTVFGRRHLAGQWDRSFLMTCQLSIEYLELAALCIAVFTWIQFFGNSRVNVYCDNQSVNDMIRSTTSSCKRCMRLIRLLTLKCLHFNVRIFTKHVKSDLNGITDALSRGQWSRFDEMARELDLNPQGDEPSEELFPIQKVWHRDD